MRSSRTLRTAAAATAVMAVATLGIASTASATIPDATLATLNPGPLASKAGANGKLACPNWSDCYEVTTRFIKVAQTDPSESGGDEIYALPMWGILDGMGLDPDPNADGTKDFFRVNITKSTFRPWNSGSNLGSQWVDREATTWIPLFDRPGSARHAKNFVFTDRVIPMSGKQFTPTEGLLFTNNFAEHDGTPESVTDRLYLESARDFQGQLQRNSTVGRAAVRSASYGVGDAISAAGAYATKTFPDIAKVVAAAGSEGATLLKKEGQPNITNLIDSTVNLVSSLSQLDADDPGEQVTTFIPFSELAAPGKLGKEQQFTITGKTDPDDLLNTGEVKAVLGVKLVKVKSGTGKPPWINYTAAPAPAPATSASTSASPSAAPRPSAVAGKLTVTGTVRPSFDGALTAGQKFPITQGTFSAVNRSNAAATIMVVSSVVYCPAANSGVSTCIPGGTINATGGTNVPKGATVTLGGSGGTAGTVPAAQVGKYAVLVSKAVNKTTQEVLATSISVGTPIVAAAAAAPAASPSSSPSVSASAPASATTFIAAAPVAGDCARISGTQATAKTCPTMTVVGGGNAKASSKIKVTAGTYDTGVQRATRQVFLYSCTAQDRATCTQIGFGVNVDTNGEYIFDLATLGGASLVGKYIHAESYVQNPSTFVGLGTFHATPKFIGVNP